MQKADNGSGPKYQQVLDSLRKDITRGVYGPGAKLPSEAQLGKRFGTSRITIGRAMRELQNLDLIDRRAGSGTYARAEGAHGLTFGLLIPNLGETEIFEPICQGMAHASQKGRHALLWGNVAGGSGRGEQALELCRQYIDRRVAGVFFAPLEYMGEDGALNRQVIAELEKARIPVVLLDRDYLPYPGRSARDLVGVDNRTIGYLAAEHLLNLGCKRIAFVGLPHSAATIDARIAGFREAAFLRGISIAPGLVQRIDPSQSQPVKEWMKRERPQAVVCANDYTASYLMHTLIALRYKIPGQVRIVGIDDLRFASLLPVPLTTVHQPCREIGIVAMSVMLDRIANPELPAREVLLPSRLVVRESCGAKLAASAV